MVNQIENLVSHGYIVIAPDHTYSAVTTRFADGDVVAYDPAALPDPAEVGEEAYARGQRDLMDVYAAGHLSIGQCPGGGAERARSALLLQAPT